MDDVIWWLLKAATGLLVVGLALIGASTYIEGLLVRRRRVDREGEEFLAFLYAQRALDQVIADGQRAVIERWLRR